MKIPLLLWESILAQRESIFFYYLMTSADFNSYSGVAWAISTRPDQINMITSWDSANSHCSDKEKTPSIISYEDNGKIQWGYSVSDKKSSIEWSKLCLLEGDDIPTDLSHSTQLQAARATLKQQRKNVVDVISDYLRQLWKHSIINIRRAIGGQLVDLCRFKVVATIPAIWPVYAQMRMHEAIEKAGILSTRKAGQTILEFLPEPEAAALATLKGISTYNQANMEVRASCITVKFRQLTKGLRLATILLFATLVEVLW
jgi:molecular chaperone DnaK (HSP70)